MVFREKRNHPEEVTPARGHLYCEPRALSGSPWPWGEHTPGLTPLPALFQLLGEDRFQDIEKIKTIGSTYMAVSGLSPEKQVKEPFGHNLQQGPHWWHIAEGSRVSITGRLGDG